MATCRDARRACRSGPRSSPNRSTRDTASMRSGASSYTCPAMATTGHTEPLGQRGDAADDLALEGLLVEEALAGDHEVGALDGARRGRPRRRRGRSPRTSAPPAAARPPASPPAAPAPSRVAHVDAVLVEVDLGQPLEAPAEQLDLGGRGALLRGEHRGGVDERRADVARDDQLDAPQPAERMEGPQGAQAAVGRGRAADADDAPGGRRRRGRRRSARRCPRSTPRPGRCPRRRRPARGPSRRPSR